LYVGFVVFEAAKESNLLTGTSGVDPRMATPPQASPVSFDVITMKTCV
jgi:hypothetical protein